MLTYDMRSKGSVSALEHIVINPGSMQVKCIYNAFHLPNQLV